MTEPLQPANELEVQLWKAVDRGELESYLHALRTATVVLPASVDRLGPATAGWPMTMVDGQAHVPVFTSPEALLADPTRRNGEYSSVTVPELAKRWPDPSWRLAVNPGLPSAVYLPGSYALSTGTRLGAVDPLAALELPDIQMDGFQDIRMGTFVTENQTEHDLLQAITQGNPEVALRALLDSTLFLLSTENDGYTLPGQPGFRWLTLGMPQGDAVPLFTSRDRVSQGVGGTHTILPVALLDLAEAWPNEELALVVNPGIPLGLRLPGPGVLGLTDLAEKLGLDRGSSDFQPGAEADQTKFDTAALALSLDYAPGGSLDQLVKDEPALLEAAAKGDRAAFLVTLFGYGDSLRLPVEQEHNLPPQYVGRPLPWVTTVAGDRTVLQVFTSPQRQREVTGGAMSRNSVEFANLLRYWPDPSWDLAINPGTPIGARLPADQIAALSEWYDQLAAHELALSFPVTARIDMQLLDAGRRGDRMGFLEILRPVKVSVSTTTKDLAWNLAPTDPAFPWEPVPVRGWPSIMLSTDLEWRRRGGLARLTVQVPFGELAAAWPKDGPDLVLNPASPISITMTAEEIQAFATGP